MEDVWQKERPDGETLIPLPLQVVAVKMLRHKDILKI